MRHTPRAPHFPSHSGHSSDRWSSETRGMPRAPDPGAETNLRGVAAYAARWEGVGRTTGIGFLHSPSLQRAPSNPPALGFGGLTPARPRELAGAVGEGATPCTDGPPSENTPPWIGSHQSSLPNAAKGYIHLENLERKRKKTDNPREGWEDDTPPPHRDLRERELQRCEVARNS